MRRDTAEWVGHELDGQAIVHGGGGSGGSAGGEIPHSQYPVELPGVLPAADDSVGARRRPSMKSISGNSLGLFQFFPTDIEDVDTHETKYYDANTFTIYHQAMAESVSPFHHPEY